MLLSCQSANEKGPKVFVRRERLEPGAVSKTLLLALGRAEVLALPTSAGSRFAAGFFSRLALSPFRRLEAAAPWNLWIN
jgi:hypothetical protein